MNQISEQRRKQLGLDDACTAEGYVVLSHDKLDKTNCYSSIRTLGAHKSTRNIPSMEGRKDKDFALESLSSLAKLYVKNLREVSNVMYHVAFSVAKKPSHDEIAIIAGERIVFKSTDDKFAALVSEWKRLRDKGSSTSSLVNDAYGQIVAMGWPIVPLLLKEVEKQSGHWFTALQWITGEPIATPALRGNIRGLREAWINWGKKNGQIR